MSQGNGHLNDANAVRNNWQQSGERIRPQQHTFPSAPNCESHSMFNIQQQQQQYQQQALFAMPSSAGLHEYKKLVSLPQTLSQLSPAAVPENMNVCFNRNPIDMTNTSFSKATHTNPAAVASIAQGHVHKLLWAAAESHFRKAHTLYRTSITPQTENDPTADWKPSIVAGLACLYSVVKICAAPRSQARFFGKEPSFSPDTEAKTRLRIALVLSEWSDDDQSFNTDDEQSEEELQLTRALMTLPNADCYLPTRYAIIAAHCRLFLRRGEYKWAEQKLKAAYLDAQKRQQQQHWSHHFVLELSNLYIASGDIRSSINALRFSIALAQKNSDKVSEAVASVQMLGQLVQMRNWTAAGMLIERLEVLAADKVLAGTSPVRTRFWALKAVVAITVGGISAAQEACDAARETLKEWQHSFAQQLANGETSYGGSIAASVGSYSQGVVSRGASIRGASYYEAHAWVMLVSALAVNGDNAYEQSIGFLQRALDGVARGELDGFKRQLQQLKLHILLHAVDIGLASLHVREAKSALDQAMSVIVDVENSAVNDTGGKKLHRQKSVWHNSRDAIALRWAMYLHRTGEFDAAAQTYQCVIKNGTNDLRYAAQMNLVIMHLCTPGITEASKAQMRHVIQGLLQESQDTALAPSAAKEKPRAALLEFVQGLESNEPVKSKTHLLSCLQICSEVANTALQGWTLCELGTQMLPAGQYEQAMKMCGVGQTIAHRANDPLQKAAAIGILTRIEKAIGDPERCAKLLELDQRFLEEFNALITEPQ
ncbi:hypothetical protein IW138_002462 [Coemansia sp. RSA 986]|nr:hypothetical protein IW138_002462 [Coemansia sp. RSA 986]